MDVDVHLAVVLRAEQRARLGDEHLSKGGTNQGRREREKPHRGWQDRTWNVEGTGRFD